jgi:hypothetical protein
MAMVFAMPSVNTKCREAMPKKITLQIASLDDPAVNIAYCGRSNSPA